MKKKEKKERPSDAPATESVADKIEKALFPQDTVPNESWSVVQLGEFARFTFRRHAEDVWLFAATLTIAKAKVPYGEWSGWKKEYLPGLSDASISRYMRVYRLASRKEDLKGKKLMEAYRTLGIVKEDASPETKPSDTPRTEETPTTTATHTEAPAGVEAEPQDMPGTAPVAAHPNAAPEGFEGEPEPDVDLTPKAESPPSPPHDGKPVAYEQPEEEPEEDDEISEEEISLNPQESFTTLVKTHLTTRTDRLLRDLNRLQQIDETVRRQGWKVVATGELRDRLDTLQQRLTWLLADMEASVEDAESVPTKEATSAKAA